MLEVILPGTNLHPGLLFGMFAARKAVFVDLLGWDVPVLDGKYEIDQFDTADARYLIVSDNEGHVASARLLPTTSKGILSGLFPMLCSGPCPEGAAIFEITRFCLDRRLRANERREGRNALVSALVSYALDAGISQYCAVAPISWHMQIATFGWQCRALGPVVRIGGEDLVALLIDIDSQTPDRLAAAGIIVSPQAATAHRFAA